MKKKKIGLNKKLFLNKRTIIDLNDERKSSILGGDGQTMSYANAQNCLCEKDPLYTRVACATTPFALTCKPELCGLAPSAISCVIGAGCASANNDCTPVGS